MEDFQTSPGEGVGVSSRGEAQRGGKAYSRRPIIAETRYKPASGAKKLIRQSPELLIVMVVGTETPLGLTTTVRASILEASNLDPVGALT